MQTSEQLKGYQIRPMQITEAPETRDLILDGLAERWGRDSFDPSKNPDVNDLYASYTGTGGITLVALDSKDGRIVGTGSLTASGWLVRMSVAMDARRTGLGRALVFALIDYARNEKKLESLRCETNDDWYSAIELYKSCGFQKIGQWDGEIHFALHLGADEHGGRSSGSAEID